MSSSGRVRAARKTPLERSAEIDRAAVGLALEKGLAAVTLRSVAARAGVAPALVGHYVTSMDLLVARTFAAVARAELNEVAAIVGAAADPIQRLASLIATALDTRRLRVTVVWVEAWAAGRRNDVLAAAVRGEMDAWHALVLGILEDARRGGGLHPDEPTAAAWQILGMIDGLNAQSLVHWGAASDRVPLALRAVAGVLGLAPGELLEGVSEHALGRMTDPGRKRLPPRI